MTIQPYLTDMENVKKVLVDEPLKNVELASRYRIDFYESYSKCSMLDDMWKCIEVFYVLKCLTRHDKYVQSYEQHKQFDLIYAN